MNRPQHVPPGWSTNPSSWSQRIPIVLLALVGTGIATYLALWQYGVLRSVFEPFFGDGTRKILGSELSFPFRHLGVPLPFRVSDAALGAFAYVLDAVTGVIGGTSRWRTMPWIVIVFAVLVGPLGLVSIGLVVAQPVLYQEWCTLCLASAVVSMLMIGPAMDEALASLQHVRRERDRGRSAWSAFWGTGPRDAAERETRGGEDAVDVREKSARAASAPWAQAAAALIGVAVIAAPALLGYPGTPAAIHDRIVGPLVAAFGCIAIWEVTRGLRWLNAGLGAWLLVAGWLLGHPAAAALSLSVGGAALLLLSLAGGRTSGRYGGGWRSLLPGHAEPRASAGVPAAARRHHV